MVTRRGRQQRLARRPRKRKKRRLRNLFSLLRLPLEFIAGFRPCQMGVAEWSASWLEGIAPAGCAGRARSTRIAAAIYWRRPINE